MTNLTATSFKGFEIILDRKDDYYESFAESRETKRRLEKNFASKESEAILRAKISVLRHTCSNVKYPCLVIHISAFTVLHMNLAARKFFDVQNFQGLRLYKLMPLSEITTILGKEKTFFKKITIKDKKLTLYGEVYDELMIIKLSK